MKGNSKKTESRNTKSDKSQSEKTKKEKLRYNPEVTEEDLEKLSHKNIKGYGDDRQLRQRKKKVDFAGEDLDIPGSKKAEESRKKGLPDEENQLFGQGGPAKENLEENDDNN
ncbi:MAG TPA: hypothetical protein VK021_00010 [Flavobacteriaceae bacterium]|nr:hypothetical protein [Flavobacteriaceae bacterium]